MSVARELRDLVDLTVPTLVAMTAQSNTPRASGKWTPKEILGHLIDSAINNHARMVRGQLQDDLVFPGYAQNDWVRIGGYRDANWQEVVSLWQILNLQIVRVMEGTPEALLQKPHARHSFDDIGVALAPGQSATLEILMQSYVDHAKHHLSQIFESVTLRQPDR